MKSIEGRYGTPAHDANPGFRAPQGYVAHYNEHRPHRALGQASPLGVASPAARAADMRVGRVDRLGGLIHEYSQVA
jgi:hypothetical protein